MTATPLEPEQLALLRQRATGVLATIRGDGRPQLSNVSYTIDDAGTTIRISVTDGRAKVANLRRDPRFVFHVTNMTMGAYVVVEGTAELSAVAGRPDDEVVDELVDVFRAVQGEHPDWDDFRRAMVAEGRLIAHLPVERSYGWLPSS